MLRHLTIVVAFALLGTVSAWAETDVGAQIGYATLSGASDANPLGVGGDGAFAFGEITQRWDRFRIHLEGLPRIAGQTSSAGFFGHSTVTLSLLNATALLDLDRRGRIRAGAGFQLANISSFSGFSGQTKSLRVSAARYEVGATLPAGRKQFVELSVAAMPNIRGLLHTQDTFGNAYLDKASAGAEVDASAGYGWRAGALTYVLGLRNVNYHTRNLNDGSLFSRTTLTALTVDVRVPIAR